MALSPHNEDFLRLCLHYSDAGTSQNPFEAARTKGDIEEVYKTNRDKLEQSDEDRAFGLVVDATNLIDYTLPFSTPAAADNVVSNARIYLREALKLDKNCHDAYRMLHAAECASPSDYQAFLIQEQGRIKEACEASRASIEGNSTDDAIARILAMRPYLRWLCAGAASSLICGRYRKCIAFATEALALEEDDPADAEFYLALAAAKLEDQNLLTRVCQNSKKGYGSAWFNLARAAMEFKLGNRSGAETYIHKILDFYPEEAALALFVQNDFTDGIYARVLTQPNSIDELILAVSEATVIMQEGCDTGSRGTLGSWIANLPFLQVTL